MKIIQILGSNQSARVENYVCISFIQLLLKAIKWLF